MVDPTPPETPPTTPAADPQPQAAVAGANGSKAQTAGKAGPASPTIDELLAKEALANLKRARAVPRSEALKPLTRKPVPAATLVARAALPQPWKTPFIALAAVVALSTALSIGGLSYIAARPTTATSIADAELRSLRDSVASLRRTVASLSSDVAANRAALDASGRSASDRFDRLVQSVERVERDQTLAATRIERLNEQRAQLARTSGGAPAADITGSIQPQRPAAARRDVITGWRVRRAFDGVAVLEGQIGVIEVVRGQDVPNLGRIEDIRNENGSWQVQTSKGVILSTR
ncbi:hypothetical protein JQ598_04720 [Bradyrhizobium sp. U87765 SZCCT0134]|uniref:hypothetical protein n=1 Tax=unclassified Bradyrhizobium TaxID=2631580 RepID=UPI001BA61A0D|nr:MULTISPECIES: hypothetical protein [unclassified Bradyrhizobium]MBR1259887.1 hypothetical protein [Bradyrhizobium sp. U87765 SZCCT0134]MBR1306020.1 hypothetical protein [Bradyrhizobium sp. U87765 SZCCT0110]MBR1322387.1 hypothetical protein [Bradyrhizobium sp. U87765 SZCCT0109]MBR1352322.1 hypothetical protein [Bradyrhizobium sp. U87765 SZCCT0048]